MKKNILFILLLLLSCNKTDLTAIKEHMYIPVSYELIDFIKSEDFLTDGSSEILFIFEITPKEYDKFIEKNKLIKFKNSYRWLDYYNEDFNFYPYIIGKELNLPKCRDLDKFFYNHWDDDGVSIECFFDLNIGLAVVRYEY